MSTAIRSGARSNWEAFVRWVTEPATAFMWAGSVCDDSLPLAAAICFIIAFVAAPPVDIDGIHEPVAGSFI